MATFDSADTQADTKCVPLPWLLASLISAQILCGTRLSVCGSFFMEVFCGEAIFTLGCVMHKVPCVRPWDILFGEEFDVLANEHVLTYLISAGFISCMHFGSPCQSMTLARLPQLRSWSFMLGRPGLSESQQSLVDLGNRLMSVTARLICLLVAAGAYFSLENPIGSWLWALEPIVAIWWLDGVIFTEVKYNAYGANYVKPTGILHNLPTLARLALVAPQTSLDMVVLRGKVFWKGD